MQKSQHTRMLGGSRVILYDGSPMEEYRIIHIFIRLLCVVHFSHLAEFTSGVLVHLSDYLRD